MFDTLFRDQAASAKSKRQNLDHLLRVTAPNERFVLALTTVILIAFAAWFFLGSVTRSHTFEGVLVETGIQHQVVVKDSGFVTQLSVAPGDPVVAGHEIARQTIPQLEREISELRGRAGLLGAAGSNTAGQKNRTDSGEHSIQVALSLLEARQAERSRIVSPVEGVVSAVHANAGDYMSMGDVVVEVRENAMPQLQPLALVTPELVNQIAAGMPAAVEIRLADGSDQLLLGEVHFLNEQMHSLEKSAVLDFLLSSGRLMGVKLHQPADIVLKEGVFCRIRVQLERIAPIDFLKPARA